jgi:hypothetical protein
MKKVQLHLPDALSGELKLITERLEISLAEVLRRGAEYMRDCYIHQLSRKGDKGSLPKALNLGAFTSDPKRLKELAQTDESSLVG